MSRITLDLLRKRSEHNEGEISTLEEIALHQENIEKIELIDKTCKHLKILLLQHNLISKIENLSKLKKLEYLNLALNNIEIIENLEGLESLKKLDLTVNFIGDLRGIKRLRCNEQLEQLFLMGNPCTDYEGFREYTIATLTQLKELDGTLIERSERIKALQVFASVEGEIIRSCRRQKEAREAEILDYREETRSQQNRKKKKERNEEQEDNDDHDNDDDDYEDDDDDDDGDETFWNRTSRHTPEERVAIAERFLRKQKRRDRERNRTSRSRITYKLKLFNSEGKPYNLNQAKVSFKLNEEEYADRIVLEVALYKHLDTSYVEVDVQPDYVRVTIKGKVLQLTLPCEVSVDTSTAERNAINGKLLVTMPRLDPLLATVCARNKKPIEKERARETVERRSMTSVREYLEIGPDANCLDFSRIVEKSRVQPPVIDRREEELCPGDDSEVPPLE